MRTAVRECGWWVVYVVKAGDHAETAGPFKTKERAERNQRGVKRWRRRALSSVVVIHGHDGCCCDSGVKAA